MAHLRIFEHLIIIFTTLVKVCISANHAFVCFYMFSDRRNQLQLVATGLVAWIED